MMNEIDSSAPFFLYKFHFILFFFLFIKRVTEWSGFGTEIPFFFFFFFVKIKN